MKIIVLLFSLKSFLQINVLAIGLVLFFYLQKLKLELRAMARKSRRGRMKTY